MDIDKFVSNKVKSVQLSPIRRFTNLVSSVPGAMSLTIGQPDFQTPSHIKQAAIQAINNNFTSYTHNQGYLKLRKEISAYLKRNYDLVYDPETEIIVTIGAEQAIDTAIRTIINPGDKVLIPSPGYVGYGACVTLSEGCPVYVPVYFEDNFKLKAEVLKNYLTPETKLLILSYPCNPTGATLDKQDLTEISKLVIENNIIVISDEIYSKLTYNNKHVSIASIEGMRERTIVINGFSKAYSMTGWRLGYIAAPAKLVEHLIKVHQYNVTCAPSISQMAGIEALRNDDESVNNMLKEYDKRRIYCYNMLLDMGLECLEPKGAFYIFPNIKKFGLSSEEFCTKLLYKSKLAVVPGSAFGAYGEGYIRISYAYSMDVLEEGMNRLKNFIKNI